MLGVVGDLAPVLFRGETLEELCDSHCYTTRVCAWLLYPDVQHQGFVDMGGGDTITTYLGSTGSHKIFGGKL